MQLFLIVISVLVLVFAGVILVSYIENKMGVVTNPVNMKIVGKYDSHNEYVKKPIYFASGIPVTAPDRFYFRFDFKDKNFIVDEETFNEFDVGDTVKVSFIRNRFNNELNLFQIS